MIQNKKILCVVTARAGSKGIPMKNVRELCGKPLFWWSVEASLQSKYVDKTVISSNCKKCKEIFNEYKKMNDFVGEKTEVEWSQRPEDISGDLSKNEEALIYTLKEYSKEYDVVVNLQPTSPCRFSGILDKCIERYIDGGYDSLLTGIKMTPFFWRKSNDKWVYNVDKNNCCNRKMRQEYVENEFVYHDNGNIYITDSKILLDRECRIGYNPCVFTISRLNSLQIDEEYDFKLIENMIKARNLESLI